MTPDKYVIIRKSERTSKEGLPVVKLSEMIKQLKKEDYVVKNLLEAHDTEE